MSRTKEVRHRKGVRFANLMCKVWRWYPPVLTIRYLGFSRSNQFPSTEYANDRSVMCRNYSKYFTFVSIKRLFGKSEIAVKTQIIFAVSEYVHVIIAQRNLNSIPHSIRWYQFCRPTISRRCPQSKPSRLPSTFLLRACHTGYWIYLCINRLGVNCSVDAKLIGGGCIV